MPTPLAHALAGTAVYLSASHGDRRREDLVLFAAAVVAACFADLDFGLNFLTGENYHHYFTHSVVFASLFTIGAYFFRGSQNGWLLVGMHGSWGWRI